MTRVRISCIISCIISLFYPVCLTQHQRVVTLGSLWFETKHKWINIDTKSHRHTGTHNAQQMQTIPSLPEKKWSKQWYLLANDMHRKVQVEWEKGTGLATGVVLWTSQDFLSWTPECYQLVAKEVFCNVAPPGLRLAWQNTLQNSVLSKGLSSLKPRVPKHHFPPTEVNEVNLETSVIIQRQTMIHNDIMFVSSRNRGSPCVTHAARWPAVPDPRVDKCLRPRIPESHVHGPRTEAERKPSPHWSLRLGSWMLYSMVNIESQAAWTICYSITVWLPKTPGTVGNNNQLIGSAPNCDAAMSQQQSWSVLYQFKNFQSIFSLPWTTARSLTSVTVNVSVISRLWPCNALVSLAGAALSLLIFFQAPKVKKTHGFGFQEEHSVRTPRKVLSGWWNVMECLWFLSYCLKNGHGVVMANEICLWYRAMMGSVLVVSSFVSSYGSMFGLQVDC